MGKIVKPQKVKLFIGIIFNDTGLLNDLKSRLCSKFKDIDFESRTLNFNYTDHYEKEFGPGLKRKFLSFSRLILPDKISIIKNITNKLEIRYSKDNKRRINLDPGYATAAKIVLATTKDYAHRIYLNNGIYAEITLTFKDGGFTPYPWAYPDYQSKDYLDIFNQIRDIFMGHRR